mmetsp:Transcript_21651/g.30337  ORF Transcript_21651/g.30337 Transcript_21651/m.30337 type:complete len:418 (-) Transcript_21651:75-1328(-)
MLNIGRFFFSKLSDRIKILTGAILFNDIFFHDNSFGTNLAIKTTKCEEYVVKDIQGDVKNDVGSKCNANIRSKLLFLGTGSSTGCPKPICSLLFPQAPITTNDNFILAQQKDMLEKCKISRLASVGDPKKNKNYRNNPSLLISHQNNDDGSNDSLKTRNIVIDVGKTFREGAIRWMPQNGICSIDAVVLSHEHMDAFGGLDDLRGFQTSFTKLNSDGRGTIPSDAIPVFLSPLCLESVKKQFYYLVPQLSNHEEESGGHKQRPKVVRSVASLNFNEVYHYRAFFVAGLKMVPLPVMHGEDFICNGYAFSIQGSKGSKTNVVYLSDISRMIPETEEFIMNYFESIDILVVDSLLFSRDHPVHYSLRQALQLVDRLKPKKVYIVGIHCDDFPEHDESNKMIRKLNSIVELAYDGLVIDL